MQNISWIQPRNRPPPSLFSTLMTSFESRPEVSFTVHFFFHGELPPGKEEGGGGGRGEWKIIKNTHFIIFVSFHLHRSSLAASSSFSCTFAPLCSQLLLKTVCVRVLLNECIYGQASSMFGSRPPLKSAPTKWWAVFFPLCLSDPMVLFNRN